MMRIATKHNRELKLAYFSFRKVLERGPWQHTGKRSEVLEEQEKGKGEREGQKVCEMNSMMILLFEMIQVVLNFG